MDQALTGWSDPVARLHAALENDELTLYCQPIRALAGPTAYPMAEVLVRMREEEKALLPPGEFLPVFEHYRMMPSLDRWVVRSVAKRLARGSKVPRFTVNLSAQTLQDEEFPAFVAQETKAAGISPGAVMFEIDEIDLLAHPEAAAVLIAALKRVGSGTLIDGFGRRSVSFAPLKTMRVDFIKVDGSITRKLLSSETALTKLKAILRVGEAIGVGIVAECVEEQDVLLRLKALGVGCAQGFGVVRPQPIDSIAA
jgi:EAL domain-containing protein (putative c-di-GMP-specific phosphodiesterase class I)